MAAETDAERARTALAFGGFVGTLAALLASLLLFPALGVPAAFLAFGAITGSPVVFFLWRIVGAVRAWALGAVVAVVASLAVATLAYASYFAGDL